MKKVIKLMFSSRKFMAMFGGILTSVLTLILGKLFFSEEESIKISQQISAMILIGMSVYAASQGIADHGDSHYGSGKN